MDIRERVLEILKRLKKVYPYQRTALKHGTPFELLVATILSAQTTDVLVNKVTPKVFKKYKRIQDYAGVPLERLQRDVKSVNFYKTKARNIQGAAKMIMEHFRGEVPQKMDSLIQLPGVARKTANIVLYNAYGMNEGVAVDTHVKRLAYRLTLTGSEDPVQIEKDLMDITPRKEWGSLSHLLIFHGRQVCKAKNPKHDVCVLYDICPSNTI
jgi:endonuclease-3